MGRRRRSQIMLLHTDVIKKNRCLINKVTSTQVFSCEIRQIFKKTFFQLLFLHGAIIVNLAFGGFFAILTPANKW